MKKKALVPTRHPDGQEPALCGECQRVRNLENTVRDFLRDAAERLRYAEVSLSTHNYQTLGENLGILKVAVMRAAEYAATLDAERRAVLDRGVVKPAESAK